MTEPNKPQTYVEALAAARQIRRETSRKLLMDDEGEVADAILDLYRFDHEQADFNNWANKTLEALKHNLNRLERIVEDNDVLFASFLAHCRKCSEQANRWRWFDYLTAGMFRR